MVFQIALLRELVNDKINLCANAGLQVDTHCISHSAVRVVVLISAKQCFLINVRELEVRDVNLVRAIRNDCVVKHLVICYAAATLKHRADTLDGTLQITLAIKRLIQIQCATALFLFCFVNVTERRVGVMNNILTLCREMNGANLRTCAAATLALRTLLLELCFQCISSSNIRCSGYRLCFINRRKCVRQFLPCHRCRFFRSKRSRLGRQRGHCLKRFRCRFCRSGLNRVFRSNRLLINDFLVRILHVRVNVFVCIHGIKPPKDNVY